MSDAIACLSCFSCSLFVFECTRIYIDPIRASRPVSCACGASILPRSMERHLRSAKHQTRLARLRGEAVVVVPHVPQSLPRHITEIVLQAQEVSECPICFDQLTMENAFLTPCGHLFCSECVLRTPSCAQCRQPLP